MNERNKMKLKMLVLFAILAVTAAILPAASAQVGGNDWTATSGQIWELVFPDGSKHDYTILYSPSTLVRTGDLVSVTVDTVYTDATPTIFYVQNLNCQTREYRYASYDISVNPPTLSAFTEWRDIKPNTAGESTFPLFCK